MVVVEYAFLMPRSPLYGMHVGGLLERADFIWHYGWYVAFGRRLLATVPGDATAFRPYVGTGQLDRYLTG